MRRRTFLKALPAALMALFRPVQDRATTVAAEAQNGTSYGQGAYGAGPYGGFWAKFRSFCL